MKTLAALTLIVLQLLLYLLLCCGITAVESAILEYDFNGRHALALFAFVIFWKLVTHRSSDHETD